MANKTKKIMTEDTVENSVKQETFETAPKSPNYTWAADAKFELSGIEYEFLYKTFATYIQQPKTQEVLAFLQGFEVLKAMLDKGIENGIITDTNK